MKRLLWTVVMLVVVLCVVLLRDSFQVTQVTGLMGPQTGATSDNISFTFTGPGTTIHATGMMQCYPWCYNDQGFQPDTSTSIGKFLL